MSLSKSKYCMAVQCDKMLWLDKNKPDKRTPSHNDSVLENGIKVGILARSLFDNRVDIEFNNDLSVMINDTIIALSQDKVNVSEASFDYNGNFCSVDILKKDGDEYEIYEVKSSTDVDDIYVDDVSYQYYVLNGLGMKVRKCYVIYINNKYVRQGKLDLTELFNIKDVTEDVIARQKSVQKKITEVNEYMQREGEEIKDLGIYCFRPYECPYFQYCSSHLVKNNIFDLKGMNVKTKLDLYRKGLYRFKDLLNENIPDNYKEQIQYELFDLGDKIIAEKIKAFLSTLYFPMYYLDFETFQESIPSFDNQRPYEQIPFQYSLHVLKDRDAELEHYEYLAQDGIDPRRELALRLVNDIPQDVCVLAYGMKFEKTIIKKLASMYPDLEKHLLNINDNMKDLMDPFKNRDYYNKAMQGYYSIKYVLPALYPNDPALNYHNLKMIHKGDEASAAFLSLSSQTEEDKEIIRHNLLKYCELDTYAMVKIWKKLDSIK